MAFLFSLMRIPRRLPLFLLPALILAACSGAKPGEGEPALLPIWAALSPTSVPVTNPALAGPPPDTETCRDRFNQWRGEFGTRAIANELCLEVPLGALAARAGVPVWTSGPHEITASGELVPDLYEVGSADFGHYNEAFVEWAINHAIVGEDRPMLRAATQPVYDQYFQRLARIFWTARQRADDPAFRAAAAQYEEYLETGGVPAEHDDFQGGFTMNIFRDASESWARDYAEGTQNDWEAVYEAQTAYGFWVRRERDGTAEQFERGLRRLLMTYDADWLAAA